MAAPVQVHNSDPKKKAELRRMLVAALGGAPACRVLETHSGPGVMHKLAYSGVNEWVGVDEDPDSPNAIHADSRLVMRAIDLSRFNLLDVDAFGSPWEHLWIFSKRRPIAAGERVSIALTSGLQGKSAARNPNLRAAGWSRQMADAVGADLGVAHGWFTGVNGAQRLVHVWFPGCTIAKWISARSRGGGAWYFGAVLCGQ